MNRQHFSARGQRYSSILLFLFLAVACHNGRKADEDTKVIDFGDGTKSEAIQNHISKVTYLPLETNDSSMFATVGKMLFRDGMIYVGDFISGKICVFDSQGKSVLVLNSRGRGSGEYVTINSFTVDDTCIDVMDLTQLKLLKYDKRSGRFVESLDLTVFAYDIEALGNGDFIFCYAPLPGVRVLPIQQSEHRIFITDSKLNVKDRMVEYNSEKYDLFRGLRLFSTSDDRLSLLSFQDNGYYVFDKEDGRLLEKVHIAFSNPIPEVSKYDVSALNGGYSYIVSSPFFCGDYASFMTKVGDGGGDYEYDFSRAKLLFNSPQVKGTFFFNIAGSHNGAFVGLITNWSATYDRLLENGFQKADPASEAAIRNDDPVLIFYTLK
ncbi:MAG: 6-bladed beta-propeller [Bacteroidales bacterium]|nr:6-bladed beta-propeller [Bacteroidales bacterium]